VVTAALVIALSLFSVHRGERLDLFHVVASIFLWSQTREPLLGVAWTLKHEMLFHCAFALAPIRREVAAPLAGLILIATGWAVPGNPVGFSRRRVS
jgi:exopolysaccharide production protein ExoZ